MKKSFLEWLRFPEKQNSSNKYHTLKPYTGMPIPVDYNDRGEMMYRWPIECERSVKEDNDSDKIWWKNGQSGRYIP